MPKYRCPKCNALNPDTEAKCWKCKGPVVISDELIDAPKQEMAPLEDRLAQYLQTRDPSLLSPSELVRAEEKIARALQKEEAHRQQKKKLAEREADKASRFSNAMESKSASDVGYFEQKEFYKAAISLSTSHMIYGMEIYETIDIVSAECVFGVDFMSGAFAGFSDTFGGRSSIFENYFKKAKDKSIHELRVKAFEVGADAVVSVSFNYDEITGGGKSMIYLIATGTAVKMKKP